MLLFIIVNLFILMEIQGSIIKDTCSYVGDECSKNEDCCTKKCFFIEALAKAKCVLDVENFSDFPESLPRVYVITPYDIKCNKNSDCIYPARCAFTEKKSDGVCREIPNLPVIRTTPRSCVIPGLHCKTDDDCCSKNCHRYFKTHITYCLSNDPPVCNLTHSECSKNSDCCSNNCDNYKLTSSVGTCQPKKNGLSNTTPLTIEAPKFCIKNEHACTSNDDCCSGACSSSQLNSKFNVCVNQL